jgi:hypothetical protein
MEVNEMAEKPEAKRSTTTKEVPKAVAEAREKGEPVPLAAADDGSESRLVKGYRDAPGKDPSTVAQIQEIDEKAARPPGEGDPGDVGRAR